jgi:hypothetical protein
MGGYATVVKDQLRTYCRIIIILLILSGGWFAFLYVVPRVNYEAMPVLVMIWASIIVLLLAVFPQILDRIKRFKIKDFEIELQNTVEQSTLEDYISLSNLDEYTFSQKGGFRQLKDIFIQATQQPSKPILLVVNLRDNRYISIPMLYIYLFFLDMVGKSITVLLISTKQKLSEISDITKESIIGVISGKTVLQIFYRRFPHLLKIFDMHIFSEHPFDVDELFCQDFFQGKDAERFFRRAYENISHFHSNFNEYLTKEDVRSWFRNKLNCRTVEVDVGSEDLKTIKEALKQGDDFFLSIKNERLRSVISLCYFSKQVTKKVLRDFMEMK